MEFLNLEIEFTLFSYNVYVYTVFNIMFLYYEMLFFAFNFMEWWNETHLETVTWNYL